MSARKSTAKLAKENYYANFEGYSDITYEHSEVVTKPRATELAACGDLSGHMPLHPRPPLLDFSGKKHTQVCTECQQEKPLSEFSPKNDTATKRHPYCRACRARMIRKARLKTAVVTHFKRT